MNADLAERIAARPALKVTPDRIDEVIASTQYIHPTGTLTICVLTLVNGFTVTGESACASPANFDAEIGRELAFKQAREKVWLLEGYLLREAIHLRDELDREAMKVAITDPQHPVAKARAGSLLKAGLVALSAVDAREVSELLRTIDNPDALRLAQQIDADPAFA